MKEKFTKALVFEKLKIEKNIQSVNYEDPILVVFENVIKKCKRVL